MDDFITVFETASPAELAAVESLLSAEGIPYLVSGAGLRAPELIPTGPPLRPARVAVPADRAEEVRALLAESVGAEPEED
jgi:hypothetical protein